MSSHKEGQTMIYFQPKGVVFENGIEYGKIIAVKDGKVVGILSELPESGEVLDFPEALLAPGFVDTHIHGMVGFDVMDATPEALIAISDAAARVGVTTFLPTTLTASIKDTDHAIQNIANHHYLVNGAKIGGIFLEGPFFVEKYRGAQNPTYFTDPDFEQLKKWKELAGDFPIKIAIAPEREGAIDFIKKAKELGVFIALGHSDATYEQACDAVESGANIFVHVYNAMSPLHHRKPGMVGAALTLRDVFAELICDGHHVHPAAAQVVTKMRTPRQTALVTDCMSAGGMPEGKYKLGEFDVTVQDGAVRMNDGNLAGSILLLKDAVKNAVLWGLASPHEAILMASLVPAASVGLDHLAGKIEVGRAADFVLLDAESLELMATYIDGVRVATGE